MALSKLEAKAWLKEIGFSDEKVEALAKEFTIAEMTKIAEGYSRQSDYDRAMNEGKTALAAQQQELADANTKLNTELAEWATAQATGAPVTAKMRADLEKAQTAALKTRQVLERIATEQGLDVTKVLSEVETQVITPQTTPAANAPDMTGYVKSDQFGSAFANLANFAATVPAELLQLSIDHQALFGGPLDTREIVKEMQTRANTRGNAKSLDPRAIWEETHKVAEKRTAVEQARIDQLVTTARAEGREEGLSQMAIPGNSSIPGKTHAAIFKGDRQSALQRPQPGGTVNAAAAAFRSGKYAAGAKTPA